MNVKKDSVDIEKISLEEAIVKAGFGMYGSLSTALAAISLMSFICIIYGNTFVVPTSACELETTTAQQGLLASVPIISILIGSLIWSYLADTRGRRTVLLICLPISALINMIATISVNWVMLMICQFISGAFASGIYSVSITLISESVPLTHRNTIVLVVSSIMFLSQGFKGVMAIPVIPLRFSYNIPVLGIYWNSWRTLMLLFSLPAIISASWLYFMQESPKFVFNTKGESAAIQVLKRIHRVNNYWSAKKELQIAGLIQEEVIELESDPSILEKLKQLFKAPLLKWTLIISFMNLTQQLNAFLVWMPTIADQFVRILQEGYSTDLTVCDIISQEPAEVDPDATPCALNETSLLVVFAVAVILCSFNLIISFFVNYVGRRSLAIIMIVICGLSCILVNVVPNMIASSVFFCMMIVGVTTVGIITAISVDLFPTNLRAMAISCTLAALDLGNVLSVQLLNWLLTVNCAAGFYSLGSLFLSAIIGAVFLPGEKKLLEKRLQNSSPKDAENEEINIY